MWLVYALEFLLCILMLAGHGAGALACPCCSTLLEGGCTQWADQCRAGAGLFSCGLVLGKREGRGALEHVGPGPRSEMGLCFYIWCPLPLVPHLHPIFCEQSSAFAHAMWQNVCMETASFRNLAELLLSQVLVHLIVSAGSLQLFLQRGLSLTGSTWSQER